MGIYTNVTTDQPILVMTHSTLDPSFLHYLPLPIPPILKYFLIISCILGFIFGSFGNVLVVLAITQSRKLRIVANSYLASLAVSDFGSCCLVLPLLAVAFASLETVISNSFLCQLVYHTSRIFGPISIQHLILIACNRYVLVTKSRTVYEKLFNKRIITLEIAFIWIFNILIYLAVSVTSYGTEHFFGKDFCFFEKNNLFRSSYRVYGLIITFVSCFVIIPLFYVLTFRTVRKSRQRVRQHDPVRNTLSVILVSTNRSSSSSSAGQNNETTGNQRQSFRRFSSYEIKLTKVNFFIFITNVLFLSPLFFSLLIGGTELMHGEIVLILFSVTMNSVTNPLVYCGLNQNFRQVFKQMLRL
ncbi:5-hydroxytryptamine receptor 2B-like [Apostichopus japonicus]|uniref:5-hydroxytryptamine receptor 2B-like n=1 Tax=Stichopus japonicus TaxID=307972 RepID=UPI003AB51700